MKKSINEKHLNTNDSLLNSYNNNLVLLGDVGSNESPGQTPNNTHKKGMSKKVLLLLGSQYIYSSCNPGGMLSVLSGYVFSGGCSA